jgi:hypothetical protein
MGSYNAGYSYICQTVDYSNNVHEVRVSMLKLLLVSLSSVILYSQDYEKGILVCLQN